MQTHPFKAPSNLESFLLFVISVSLLIFVACGDSRGTSSGDNEPGTAEYLESLNTLDPKQSAIETYQGIENPLGVDSGMEPMECEVYLLGKSEDDNKLYYRTTFGHDGDLHPTIEVSFTTDRLQLSGTGINKIDEMIITLTQAGNHQTKSQLFLKWQHDNHDHFSRCYRLVKAS